MHQITTASRRLCALAPAAALLLLALCLLAGSVQAADAPRYVVGDILEITSANQTDRIVVASVDTTSLSTPYYTTYGVVQSAGRYEIPSFWHHDLKVDEQNLVENLQAHRIGHIDPILVIITDETVTGGDMKYTGLSLAEALAGVVYAVEPAPGESSVYPNVYVVGDILGNVTNPNLGSVIAGVGDSDGTTWYRVYFDAVRSGDRWILDEFYNNDMAFTASLLDQNGMRRVAHADPHTVIVNDTMTNTGDIGWYRLSLAEIIASTSYDSMGAWHFNTGDILGNETSATRYIVGAATASDTVPAQYTLYEVVHGADGWRIPTWVNGGVPFAVPLEAQLGDLAFDLVDHTDPHFAVVTDPTVTGGVTFSGLSLGEILEGTPGYPVEQPPVGGDKGYFLVSTVPASADIYLVDISGTRYLQGTTSAGPLNVTIMLTATPVKQIVANLSGYREAVYTITQYPAKGQTVPVSLTLEPAGGPTPYRPHPIPGRIQAEDYDLGGEGHAYHDTTAGNSGGAYRHEDVDIETAGGITNVGWVRSGEYLTYTATVQSAATYTMTARVASPNSGRAIVVSVDGTPAATLTVPNTGSFATFRTVQVPVTLAAGTHTLRLTFQGDGQNIDWIAFASGGVITTPTPTPTPGAGGPSFTAAPNPAKKGTPVKFTLTPSAGKTIRSAWWSFDATAHLNTWNSRTTNPTFYYPSAGTYSPLVKITYTDGSTETVQRTGYIRAT